MVFVDPWLTLILYRIDKKGPLAQLVEHLTFNQGVEGSNPSGPTILRAYELRLADHPSSLALRRDIIKSNDK